MVEASKCISASGRKDTDFLEEGKRVGWDWATLLCVATGSRSGCAEWRAPSHQAFASARCSSCSTMIFGVTVLVLLRNRHLMLPVVVSRVSSAV